MPMVLVAIVSSAASAIATGFMVTTLGFAAGSFLVTAVGFAVSYAVSAIGAKLFGGGSNSQAAAVAAGPARIETVRSTVATRRVVYGEVRVGGTLVFAESTGVDNKFMHMIFVVSHGEIASIDSRYWLADRISTDPEIASKLYMETRLGAPGQTPISIPGTAWTGAHLLAGLAYVYLRLEYDADAFPGGLPSPSFLVRGRKLYDPRTGATAYSANSSLVMLDYLRAEFGIQCEDALIDFDSFAAAANISDEQVATYEASAVNETQCRYETAGVIKLDASPTAVLESFETSCGGQLIFSYGQYRMHVAAFDYPTVTIDETYLRADPVIRVAPSRTQSFNTARGTYIDPQQDWLEADMPEIVNEPQLLEDGAEVVQALSYPLTTSCARAQRLAKIDLYRNQNASSVQLKCNWKALGVEVWQTVKVSGFAPLSERVYRVTEYTLADGGGVDLSLQEESEDMYDFARDTDEQLQNAPGAVPTISALPWVTGGTARVIYNPIFGTLEVAAEWQKSTGWVAEITYYAVELLDENRAVIESISVAGTEKSYRFSVTEDTLYYVRVRAVDLNSTAGPWRYIPTTGAFIARPAQVEALTFDGAQIVWQAHPAAVGGYEYQLRPGALAPWGEVNATADTFVYADSQNLFRVRAIGRSGVRGYWSKTFTAP